MKKLLVIALLLALPVSGFAEEPVTCNFTYKKTKCTGVGENYKDAEEKTLENCPEYFDLSYLERNNAWANPKHFQCTVRGGAEG